MRPEDHDAYARTHGDTCAMLADRIAGIALWGSWTLQHCGTVQLSAGRQRRSEPGNGEHLDSRYCDDADQEPYCERRLVEYQGGKRSRHTSSHEYFECLPEPRPVLQPHTS